MRFAHCRLVAVAACVTFSEVGLGTGTCVCAGTCAVAHWNVREGQVPVFVQVPVFFTQKCHPKMAPKSNENQHFRDHQHRFVISNAFSCQKTENNLRNPDSRF